MDAESRKKLFTEAQRQMSALKKIAGWRNAALAVSSVGVAVLYAGKTMTGNPLLFCIFGAAAVIVGAAAALVLNLGIKNEKNNVGKMLRVLESGEEA